jgi:hypothetical protein
MNAWNDFISFDQARAARVWCQHVADELEGLSIRDFIQIALQPERYLCAVQDDLGVWKAGVAFHIDKAVTMVAVEVREENGLNRSALLQ